MASLMPLIQDLLPMILPSSISVTKACDILPPPTPTPPSPPRIKVISRDAVVNKTDKMCASVLIVKPHSSSSVRHHGEQGTCQPIFLPSSYNSSIWYKDQSHLPTQKTKYPPSFQDAIIYAAAGTGVLLSSPKDEGDEPERFPLGQGDFAVVPSWTEHQALNESEVDVLWVIIRSGSSPVEVNLTDWGGAEAKEPLRR
ncbi:hypothetical protein B0T22DRAFT_377745 [Podospora appendiculata]|uniref:Uncharacterized protein n=1 Tax=Podospora appendiculata TaxID=314037 RepID=A0AAE1CDM4_9PEZI|nr:hypothetical protein B0T22DRAFT_377745 [Podospora appendiculata]